MHSSLPLLWLRFEAGDHGRASQRANQDMCPWNGHAFNQEVGGGVKLNRVFFPRWSTQAHSLGGWFTSQHLGTAGISLIHSCASIISRRGIWRVIVTPTVYPHLAKSLCIDNQSTGQKSPRGTSQQVPSQSCISIKQSDSPEMETYKRAGAHSLCQVPTAIFVRVANQNRENICIHTEDFRFIGVGKPPKESSSADTRRHTVLGSAPMLP